ncbi:MAG: hypothetical protein HY316_00960 [Acidobacteria bacterium]|nr:hypothetical protein [Acidobacteriota bacterium]
MVHIETCCALIEVRPTGGFGECNIDNTTLANPPRDRLKWPEKTGRVSAMRYLRPIAVALVLWTTLSCVPLARGQERRAYEGVVSWKKATIGTVILVEIRDQNVSGWLRIDKPVAIDGGSVIAGGLEFRSTGNTYRIDERRGRIIYSGPQGDGDRYITGLTRLTGRLEELVEATENSPPIATIDVNGRRRDLRYGTPTLWKRSGPPFETFKRLEELLGKEISVWVADANLRSGRIVVVEEPDGMDIPLKPPKKPQEKK